MLASTSWRMRSGTSAGSSGAFGKFHVGLRRARDRTSALLGSSSSSDPTTPDLPVSTATQSTRARTTKTTTTTTTHAPTTAAATYTVQAGDFLSTVAAKTGVSVERLRALNPGLDANAMHVGQQIRLR